MTPKICALGAAVLLANTGCVTTNPKEAVDTPSPATSSKTASSKTTSSKTTPAKPRSLPSTLGNSLVLHFAFDQDKAAIVQDSGPKRSNGEARGPEWTSNGVFGGGFEFDGSDRAECIAVQNNGDVSPGADDFTISLWFKSSSQWQWMGLVWDYGRGKGMYNITIKDNKIGCGYRDVKGAELKCQNKGPSVVDGKWHHVAWVKSGHTGLAYLDGNLLHQDTNDKLGEVVTTGGKHNPGTTIGAYTVRWKGRFMGTIDEVRMHRRAVSAEEVAQLYQARR